MPSAHSTHAACASALEYWPVAHALQCDCDVWEAAALPNLPGARILDGQFTAVQQAVGTAKGNTEAAVFLSDFVEQSKKSGLVAKLIDKYGVTGRLSVASAS